MSGLEPLLILYCNGIIVCNISYMAIWEKVPCNIPRYLDIEAVLAL